MLIEFVSSAFSNKLSESDVGIGFHCKCSKQTFEENEKNQCQEHINDDLTRPWPRPGRLNHYLQNARTYISHGLRRLPPALAIAHCSKIADSEHFCKRILDLWCPNLSFGMAGASIVASWGSLGQSWDIGGAQERTI